MTQAALRAKLLLLGEAALRCIALRPACLSARVQGGFKMHIHERCRLGGESGGAAEANLGPGDGDEQDKGGERREGRRRG